MKNVIADRPFSGDQPEIMRLLSSEIVKRYYYQKGELRQNLKDDKVLQKALEVLADPALYRKTLSKPEDVPAVASK